MGFSINYISFEHAKTNLAHEHKNLAKFTSTNSNLAVTEYIAHDQSTSRLLVLVDHYLAALSDIMSR